MLDHNPIALRKVYFDAWSKREDQALLSPLEAMILEVLARHPEYHLIFDTPSNLEASLEENFGFSHNPFFHLGLHIAILEQVQINKPIGIRPIYQRLVAKHQDKNTVEHKMMDCLARHIQTVMVENKPFNEKKYIQELKAIR